MFFGLFANLFGCSSSYVKARRSKALQECYDNIKEMNDSIIKISNNIAESRTKITELIQEKNTLNLRKAIGSNNLSADALLVIDDALAKIETAIELQKNAIFTGNDSINKIKQSIKITEKSIQELMDI